MMGVYRENLMSFIQKDTDAMGAYRPDFWDFDAYDSEGNAKDAMEYLTKRRHGGHEPGSPKAKRRVFGKIRSKILFDFERDGDSEGEKPLSET